MYLVFTRMSGESSRRRLRSLLLILCYVFRALKLEIEKTKQTTTKNNNCFLVVLLILHSNYDPDCASDG